MKALNFLLMIFLLIFLIPLIYFLFDSPDEKISHFTTSRNEQEEYKNLSNDLITSYGYIDVNTDVECTFKEADNSDGYIYSASYSASIDGTIDYEKLYQLMLELEKLQPSGSVDQYLAGIMTIYRNEKMMLFQLDPNNKLIYANSNVSFDYEEDGSFVPEKPFPNMEEEYILTTGYGKTDDIRKLDNGQVAYIWITNNAVGYVAYVKDGYVVNTATEQVRQ